MESLNAAHAHGKGSLTLPLEVSVRNCMYFRPTLFSLGGEPLLRLHHSSPVPSAHPNPASSAPVDVENALVYFLHVALSQSLAARPATIPSLAS